MLCDFVFSRFVCSFMFEPKVDVLPTLIWYTCAFKYSSVSVPACINVEIIDSICGSRGLKSQIIRSGSSKIIFLVYYYYYYYCY